MIRRINFFAGPGAGKSTTSTYIFQAMKKLGLNVEYVPEYVKKWTYYNKKPKSFDQVYLFAKQLHNEDSILSGGFDYVICDSPLMLTYYYATRYGTPGSQNLYGIAQEFENAYSSLNIFIERGDKLFNKVGRFQDLEQSLEIDKEVKSLFPDMPSFKYNNQEEIFNFIKISLDLKE